MSDHESKEKFDNDYVLRNDHRIKTTQPISMILVSFFLEDNVLSDEIKICYIFEYSIKVTKIERSAFWGTLGIHLAKKVSSRLILFDITLEIFNRNYIFKM